MSQIESRVRSGYQAFAEISDGTGSADAISVTPASPIRMDGDRIRLSVRLRSDTSTPIPLRRGLVGSGCLKVVPRREATHTRVRPRSTSSRVQSLDAFSRLATYPAFQEVMAMRIDQFTFGSIRIDGVVYEHDVVIARGRVRKRKKKPSKPFRDAFGHTPLSIEEDIPWDCQRLVVGTGADGALPVMDEVKQEAARRQVALLTASTREAIRTLQAEPKDTNAILHVTC